MLSDLPLVYTLIVDILSVTINTLLAYFDWAVFVEIS